MEIRMIKTVAALIVGGVIGYAMAAMLYVGGE